MKNWICLLVMFSGLAFSFEQEQPMKRAAIDDIELEYEIHGDGEPILPMQITAQDLLTSGSIQGRMDLPAEKGMEAILAVREIRPGGTTGKHTQTGSEMLYIMEGVAVGKMSGNLDYSGISGISLNVGGTITVVPDADEPAPGNHVTLRVRGLAKLLTHVQSAADANANATPTAVLIINGHRIEANGSAGKVSVSFEGMTPTVETGLPTSTLATTSSSFAEHIQDIPIGSEIPFELIVELRVSNTDPFGLFLGTVAAALAQLTEHACTITAE